jgi:hypothetical protein
VLEALGVGVVVPHESTIRRVLQQVDAPVLEGALQAWALAQLATQIPQPGAPVREQRRVLALDGKTVRGARAQIGDGIAYQPHLVSVIDQAGGAVLGQVQVDTTNSEITAFTTLLAAQPDQLGLQASGLVSGSETIHLRGGGEQRAGARPSRRGWPAPQRMRSSTRAWAR